MPKSARELASKCGQRIRIRFAEYHGSTANLWDRLGWTPIQLAEHLERHFYNDMSWENFGSWQIDHTIPLSLGRWNENFGSNQNKLNELQERVDRGNEPPHVRDAILSIIEDYKTSEKLWSIDNLRPLFREDHVMKTEFEHYLMNRDARMDEYHLLCEVLYDYYGNSPAKRRRMKNYYHHKWPKKWIREINQRIELETDSNARTISSWWNYHSNLRVEPRLCSGLTKMGFPCQYKAMNGDDMCYLHSKKEIKKCSEEEVELLKEMIVHVPTIPAGFFSRRLPNSKSRYPSEDYWKLWINKFPMDHPIYRMYQRTHYNLEKTDIASMLIKYATPGIHSLNTLLLNHDVETKKTKWQKFWKAHEIVLEEFLGNNFAMP